MDSDTGEAEKEEMYVWKTQLMLVFFLVTSMNENIDNCK